MSDIENMLREFGDVLQAEANVEIKKAMDLFIKGDDEFKQLVLQKIGFSGELTAQNLREYFDTMELLDMLPDLIKNMENYLAVRKQNQSE